MRAAKCVVVLVAAVGGCVHEDQNPNWSPRQDYPAWAYDAPFYYRPTDELTPAETVGEGIPVYYTGDEYFFIRHPGGYQLTGVPRVGVWASSNGGHTWQKAGYYGVEQTHFLFKADRDARYWIRFVGPSQGVAKVPPGMPHRVYVVDRRPPQIELEIDPPPFRKVEDREVPYTYRVGQPVTLRWVVREANLEEETVEMGTSFAEFPDNLVWSEWPESLPRAGSMIVEIPPEAAADGGLRFRIEATDKAGNVGMCMTDVLQVTTEGATEAVATVKPVRPERLRREMRGRREKPGWPHAGAFYRGGTRQVLKWLPEEAAEHETVALQFTPNNGQVWRTLLPQVQPDAPIQWTVPTITSKNCRLRVAAMKTVGEETVPVPLATSPRFIVDTVSIEMKPPSVTEKSPD